MTDRTGLELTGIDSRTDYSGDLDWEQIDRHIAKQCKVIPFKRILDSFKSNGVIPLQHMVYSNIFKNFAFDRVPGHLREDFMKYIIRKIKNHMFDGFLPHHNDEFTKYLFESYTKDYPFVQLFAYGFGYWTFDKLINTQHFISWISWILAVYNDRAQTANLYIYANAYRFLAFSAGLSGLRYTT
jgi:hypothetical protein